jgi:cytoskeletal protein CcmA (bactofilin family)
MKPARPAAQAANVAPLPRAAASVPPRTPEAMRPAALEPPPRSVEAMPRPAEAMSRPAPAPAALPPAPPVPRSSDTEVRKLIVGREISLSGEITSCDKLIVEGSVEANLQNCQDVDIAESGLFKGSATIDDLEVRGRFEGSLVVRKRLLVRATGRVSGTIRYGQIEIERGGQISGDIQAGDDDMGRGY